MGFVIYIFFFAAAAALTAKAFPRKRPAAVAVWLAAAALFYPVALWLNFFIAIDFSRPPGIPDGFIDTVIYDRSNERLALPVNRNSLISDREISPVKAPDVKMRIMLAGDSFAAGHGLGYDQTLARQLEKRLGPGYEVINAAFFGANADTEVRFLLAEAPKYKPDMIILWSRADDIMPISEKLYLEQTMKIIRDKAPHWPRALKNFVFQKEILMNRTKFESFFESDPKRVLRDNLFNPLERLDRYADAEGIHVLMLGDKCERKTNEVCAAQKSAAKKFRWRFYDPNLAADLSLPKNKIPGNGHPTAEAISAIADSLSKKISAGFLQRPFSNRR